MHRLKQYPLAFFWAIRKQQNPDNMPVGSVIGCAFQKPPLIRCQVMILFARDFKLK
jgi:hypothetical protein